MTRARFDTDPFVRDAIEELFAPRIAAGVSPGSIVAVFGPGGDIEYARGFGVDRPGGTAPDLDTAFRIASCSKSFTAAALLLLRDRGALVLDQPITDFVPDFHWADGFPDVPTVRHLLSMSGGLATDDPWADRQEGIGDDEFGAIIAAGTPRDSIPGTRFEYSNYGFALLGRVVAAVSGAPFIDTVTSELLEPLGLAATGYTVAGRPGRVAPGWRRDHEGGWHELPFSGPGAFSPIGGVVTTARELARWGAWLASALTDAPLPGPLSAASRRELQQVQRTIPGARAGADENGYGFGLFVEKGRLTGHTVSHSGGYPGFSAQMRWNAPGGFGVIGFENRSYAGVTQPVAALADALIGHVGRVQVTSEPWPDTVRLARAADRLLDAWATGQTDAEAEADLSANVALDVPLDERRAMVVALGLLPSGGEPELEASVSPARVSWRRRTRAGSARVEILATPTVPAFIQRLKVDAE